MKIKKTTMILSSLVILLPIVVGLLLWEHLPEQVAIHWNWTGEADGWASRTTAVFGMPLFLLAIHWLCTWITMLDQKGRNQNAALMNLMLWICPGVALLVTVAVFGTAMGLDPEVERLVPGMMGILFAIIGNYMPKCTWNHTIGIKLPWTLASEENWDKTHRMAGKIWVVGGLMTAVLGYFQGLLPMAVILLAMVVIPTVYSWRLSRHG